MSAPVTARAALLQALADDEGHGMELIERIKRRTRGHVDLGQGSVYPALRSLAMDGFATVRREVREEGGRPRLIYQITQEGRKAAKEDARAMVALFGLASS